MPPQRVYVNLPAHVANGHPMTVTTTKSANKSGTRQSAWSIAGQPTNLGDQQGVADTSFTGGAEVTEKLPLQPAQRTFENGVKLGHIGGNVFTVSVKKINAGLGSRAITSEPLETWRKIFITVNAMRGLEAAKATIEGSLPALLAPAFIELEVREPATPADGELAPVARVDSDALPGLIATMPASLYAGDAPAHNSPEGGLWARVMLVEGLTGTRTTQTLQVTAADGAFTHPRWTLTLRAPDGDLFFAPSAVTALRLRLLAKVTLNAPVDFAATSRKSGGSTTWTCTATTGEVDPQLMARARQPITKSVTLILTRQSGGELRVPLKSYQNGDLVFQAETSQVHAIGQVAWQRDGTFTSKVVEVQTNGFDFEFAPDGTLPGGEARVTLARDERSYTIEVTDGPANALLTTAFAAQAGEAEVSVTHRTGRNCAGFSKGRTIAVAVADLTARTHAGGAALDPALLRVVAHEIIHSLGGVSPDLQGGNHPTYYPQTLGGVASGESAHCSFGTVLTPAATLLGSQDPLRKAIWEPNKPQIYAPANAQSPICVMYHRAQFPNFAASTLCANCILQLRTLDLKKTSIKLNG